MDPSTLIPPLIALVAPIVVTAIRKQSSRIEERTERLQYWKTFFEVALLAGNTVSEEAKQLCLAEMTDGEDELRNFNNKFVSFVTTAYTLILMLLALSVLELVVMSFLDMVRWQYQNQPSPPQTTPQQFKDAIQQIRNATLIIEALVMCLIWFWARWKIRDFVWNGLRPGKRFHSLLTANDIKKGDIKKGVAECVLLLLVLLAYFVMFQVSQHRPLNFLIPPQHP